MKKTFDLYRCSPLDWAHLPFEHALYFRIDRASEAMDFYRTIANKPETTQYRKDEVFKLYQDSEDAIAWNRVFIEEIKEARRRINELTDSKDEDWTLPSQWHEDISIYSESSTECIFAGTWRWLKNSLKKLVGFVTKN